MRPDRRMDKQPWLTGLAGVCLILLAAQALLCLWQARALQLRLDHAHVAAEAARALQPELVRPAGLRSLRPVVDALLQRPDLGLRFLAVQDAEGVVLARAGWLEALRLPLLPQRLQEQWRDTLYAVWGSYGSRSIRGRDGRLLGSIEYSLEPGAVEGVRVEAVAALRLAGWISAGLTLPLAAMVAIGLYRQRRAKPEWLGRADPDRPVSGNGWGASDVGEFRDRAGEVMDALQYALIVTDREGVVRYLNKTAEHLTGWSMADAQGRLLYSIFHLVDGAGAVLPGPADGALREGRPQAMQSGWLRRRHGETVPIEMTAYPMRNRQRLLDGITLLFRDTTPQQQALQSLRREARLSQAVVDHLEEGLLITDMAGVVHSANARAERMFGYSRDELVGATVTKLMPVPFLNAPTIRITDYVASRNVGKLPKVVGWRKDATTFPIELWVQPMRVESADGLVVVVRDISERLRGENLAMRLGRLLDNASEEVYIFEAQSLYFLEVSRTAQRNLGYSPEQLARMTPLDISAELSEESFHHFLADLRGGDKDHLVYRCRHKRADGSSYPVEVRLNFSRDEEPPVFMAIATDIGDRLLAEERLSQLAHFDALTGLPNRVMLHDRLQQALLAAQRGPRLLGVFFLDLDRFKQINDLHGHAVGDQVLKAVADRLRSAVRPSDTVARLSGDEFVILAPGLRSAEDAQFVAAKLLDRFAQPLDLPGLAITCRPSIGITLYPLDDSDADGLLRHADNAMYQAKQAGRGCWRLFTAEIDPGRRRQFDLEREIHAAVALNQFHLMSAPVLDAEGRAHALLAALRWQHPRHGVIEGTELWQAASRAGLVADLELWQICRACEQLDAAAQEKLPLLPYLLPVSGWQLRDRQFIAHLGDLLARYRVPAACLVFAVTPDGLIEASDRHADTGQLLRAGVRLALRDFNLMPASPSLPLAYVLAGASVLHVPERVQALRAALPRQTVIIATGVSTPEELRRCHAAGIACAAGPAVASDLDPSALAAWLRNSRIDDAV